MTLWKRSMTKSVFKDICKRRISIWSRMHCVWFP
nr:MAG TPA: hypothetical protein [Caudoviricetes sp.]